MSTEKIVKCYTSTRNRKDSRGNIKRITVKRKYTVRPDALTAEQLVEIESLLLLGVTKAAICKKYDVSYHVLMKFLNRRAAEKEHQLA